MRKPSEYLPAAVKGIRCRLMPDCSETLRQGERSATVTRVGTTSRGEDALTDSDVSEGVRVLALAADFPDISKGRLVSLSGAWRIVTNARTDPAGATLSLKSETTLSLYFNSATEPTLTCENEGYTCETKQTGANEYVIRIRGIAAYDLDKVFTVDVNGHPAVDYSPMTYCCKSQNSSDAKLANTVKALYLYMLAAKDYFDEPENGGGN